eukprot:3046731-Prymnesium_polylepis.1
MMDPGEVSDEENDSVPEFRPPPDKDAAQANKRRKTESTKMSNSLAIRDEDLPVFIYLVRFKGTSKVIYVGKTKDCSRRWRQHEYESSKCSLLRARIQERGAAMYDFSVVEGLECGVPANAADKYEGWYISLYHTVYDIIRNKDGCNCKNADHIVDLTDKIVDPTFKLQTDPSEWYTAPEEIDSLPKIPYTAAGRLRGEHSVCAAYDDCVPESDPDKLEIHVLALRCRAKADLAEKPPLTLWELAREETMHYNDMPSYQNVERDSVVASINVIREKLAEDQNDIKKMANHQIASINSNHFKSGVNAAFASHCMGAIYQFIAHFEEQKLIASYDDVKEGKWRGQRSLKPIHEVRMCLEVREWSAKNKWKKPVASAQSIIKVNAAPPAERVEEGRLGLLINRWGCVSFGRRNIHIVKLMLRDMPWLDRILDTGEMREHVATLTNMALHGGWGITSDPEAKVALLATLPNESYDDRGKVCRMLNDFSSGRYSQPEYAKWILAGIPQPRKDWYMGLHMANREGEKEKNKQKQQRERQVRIETQRRAKLQLDFGGTIMDIGDDEDDDALYASDEAEY